MENGICVGVKTDKGTTAVHIPQEVVEFARLNRRTQARIDKANAKVCAASLARAREACEAANRRKAVWRLARQMSVLALAAAGCCVAGHYGLMSAWIAAPVAAACLLLAGCKLGRLREAR